MMEGLEGHIGPDMASHGVQLGIEGMERRPGTGKSFQTQLREGEFHWLWTMVQLAIENK